MSVWTARLVRSTYQRLGAESVWSFAVLLSALWTIAAGIAAVTRSLSLAGLFLFVFLAALTAWNLAGCRLPGWGSFSLSCLAGLVFVALVYGRLFDPMWSIGQSLGEVQWGWGLEGGFWIEARAVEAALTQFGEASLALLERTWLWASSALRGVQGFDPLVSLLFWSLGLWIVTTWAAWYVRRNGQFLVGLAPGGAILATTLAYANQAVIYLVLFGGLLWFGHILADYFRREQRWQAGRIDSPDMQLELVFTAIGVSIFLMTLALITPSISLYKITQTVRELGQARDGQSPALGDSLGIETRPDPAGLTSLDLAHSPGLARQHLLGSGPELSERLVMYVALEGYRPEGLEGQNPGLARIQPPAFYWRSLTYDLYTGRGWATSGTTTREIEAGVTLRDEVSSLYPAYRVFRQQIEMAGGEVGYVYRAGEVLASDHGFRMAQRFTGDIFGAEIPVQAYTVDSLLALPTREELLRSGLESPAWLAERYLRLPEELPRRVGELALDLTATQATPYERARAIESYLRQFPYTLDLDAPPPGVDVVDYFLFDLQRGYCDYYASAMVVLARAAGLPARLVVGYASGEWDGTQARFVVSEADAHSWAEVYLSGVGWVEFEPTGGRPAILREDLGDLGAQEVGEMSPLEPATSIFFTWGGRLAGIALGLLASSGLLGLLVWLVSSVQLARLPPAPALALIYRRLYWQGRKLDIPAAQGSTMHEFSSRLSNALGEHFVEQRDVVRLEQGNGYLLHLTELYSRSLFSPFEPGESEKKQARRAWDGLRQVLWQARLRRFFGRIKLKIPARDA